MKYSLEKIESLLKFDGYGIMIYWDLDEGEEEPELYNTVFMSGEDDGASNIASMMRYDLLEAFFRFAYKNSPLQTNQSMLANMPVGKMFEKDEAITKFHKKLKQYSFGKEIVLYCEEGGIFRLRILETLDLRTREAVENLVAEAKANSFKELLEALSKIMTDYYGSLI